MSGNDKWINFYFLYKLRTRTRTHKEDFGRDTNFEALSSRFSLVVGSDREQLSSINSEKREVLVRAATTTRTCLLVFRFCSLVQISELGSL